MEFQHLLKRKLSTDITVHNDKGVWTSSSDLVTEVVEASSCAKRSIFLQISHRHLVQGGTLSQNLLLLHLQLMCHRFKFNTIKNMEKDLLMFLIHICNK